MFDNAAIEPAPDALNLLAANASNSNGSTLTANTEDLTHRIKRPGLLVLGDKRVLHVVSLAKKTVAFFRRSFLVAELLPSTGAPPIHPTTSGVTLLQRKGDVIETLAA